MANTASSLSNASPVAAPRRSAWWTTSCTKTSRRNCAAELLASASTSDSRRKTCHHSRSAPSARTPPHFQKHRARRLHDRHRLLPEERRLRRSQGRGQDDPHRDRERGQDLRPARPRRRRFPLRREVELHQAGRAKAGLPHLQRRRIRARHVQGSLHHSSGSASADRGHVDQLFRAQRSHRLHLHPR